MNEPSPNPGEKIGPVAADWDNYRATGTGRLEKQSKSVENIVTNLIIAKVMSEIPGYAWRDIPCILTQ